jgi:hypothetical protein
MQMDEEQRRVVYRYLVARVGLRKAGLPCLTTLDHQMRHDFDLLAGGVLIDRNATPPIIGDEQDPHFFAAIVQGNEGAIDITPRDLEQTRRFVLYDQGCLPPPFGRSWGAIKTNVSQDRDDPLDLGDEWVPSALEVRTAAQEARWGSYAPDTSRADQL